MHLGRSPLHARSVALVLNLDTGRVSPQYHVEFDPSFHTMRKSFGGKSPKSSWQHVCGFLKNKFNPKSCKGKAIFFGGKAQRGTYLEPLKMQPLPKPDFVSPTMEDPKETATVDQSTESTHPTTSKPEGVDSQQDEVAPADSTLRRSTRISKPVIGNRLVDAMNVEIHQSTSCPGNVEDANEWAPAQGEIFCLSAMFPFDTEPFEDDPLMAMAASADPDTLYYHQAMKEEDSPKFREAMEKEIVDQ